MIITRDSDRMIPNLYLPNQMIRAFLALALTALAWNSLEAQSSSTCRSLDADGLRFRSYVRQLVTTTDGSRIQLRTSLGLSAMDSAQVTLVTDNATCARAAQGINTAQGTANLARQLYVVKVGQLFAAQDPGNPSGEWWPTVTLDRKFKAIGVVLAP